MSGVINYGAWAAVLPKRNPGGAGDRPGLPGPRSVATETESSTMRRRRLWELPNKYHCPVIGVCFDVAELRRMINKYLKYPPETTDYMWHTIAVGVCDTRCPLSEQFGRILDRRYAQTIRKFAACKSADDLRASWREICRLGMEIPAGLWAASTHPLCSEELEQEIHSDIHMIQHQVGAGVRIDLKAMKALRDENEQLRIEQEAMRKRHELQRAESLLALQELTRRVAALQAELSARDAAARRVQRELDRLVAALPDLRERELLLVRLQDAESRLSAAREREQELEREVVRLRDLAAYAEETIEALNQDALAGGGDGGVDPLLPSVRESLLGKCVLCVGGRSGSINSYRDLIEQHGGRFMHHDGGREESLHRIEGALAAADIVICQVGCISHNAYWRVKEMCKRTGKPCMFVKSNGVSSLGRLIGEAARLAGDEGADSQQS